MLRRFSLLVCLAGTTAASFAQLAPGTEAKLDTIFAPWSKPNEPGGVVGVVKDGKLVYAKGFGLANLDYGLPLTSKSVTDIGSITKHFTATAILMLEDEGKVNLDDPIRKYIPEVPAEGDITIRQLLSHTSGIRDYLTCFALSGWDLTDSLKQDKALEMIGRQQSLNFAPSTSWNYSNTGYFLAGLVVERVSKESLGKFLKQRVFKPLQMDSTLIYEDLGAIIPNRADSFSKGLAGWQRQSSAAVVVGDGGLMTTVEDFAKWDEALRTNKLKIKGGHLARLSTPTKLKNGAPTGYGLGLFVDSLNGVKRIQHGGAWLGYFSQYSMYPEKGLSVFAFGNNGANLAPSLSDEAAKLLLQLPEAQADKKPEIAWTPEIFQKLEGKWLAGGLQFRLYEFDGKKMLQATGHPAFELFASSPDQVFLKVVPATITKTKADEKGVWTEAELVQKAGDREVKVKLTRAVDFKPTPESLAKWVGSWYSPDLKTIYSIRSTGNSLMVKIGDQKEELPFSLSSDELATAGVFLIKYVPTEKPMIIMDAGRANGFKLSKLSR